MATELRDMRRKEVSDKKEQSLAKATMSSIEAKARQQYEKDIHKAGEAQRDGIGTWVSLHVSCMSERPPQ